MVGISDVLDCFHIQGGEALYGGFAIGSYDFFLLALVMVGCISTLRKTDDSECI